MAPFEKVKWPLLNLVVPNIKRIYCPPSPTRLRLLSVTESFPLPPEHKGGHMPNFSGFNLREWLVPPVLMPIFLVLLVAAAMIAQW
jgi:hypothetical protein